LSLNSPKFIQSQERAQHRTSAICLSNDSSYIVWCGLLLCICDWSVWRCLETYTLAVPAPICM